MARREQSRSAISTVYKMEKTLVYVCLLLVLAMTVMAGLFLIQARYYNGHHGSDVGVPAAIAIVSAICAYVWSVYEVRFDETVLRLGLYARVSVP
jgi:hypothetical protein